jgi:hypothetical protein
MMPLSAGTWIMWHFLSDILKAAIPPVATAVFGTFVVGVMTSRVLDRFQASRQLREAQQQLAVEMTEIASALYYAIQIYNRAEGRDDRQAMRKSLDEEYQKRRVAGDALEVRLKAYLPEATAQADWHAVMDLLTVRYLHAAGRADESSLQRNAGPLHSGLTVEQLKDADLVRTTYRERLTAVTSFVIAQATRKRVRFLRWD